MRETALWFSLALLFFSGAIGALPPLLLRRNGNSVWLRMAMSFTGGTLLSAALIHLLPDGTEQLAEISKKVNFPLANLGAVCGFLILLLLDTVVNNILQRSMSPSSSSNIAGVSQPGIPMSCCSTRSRMMLSSFSQNRKLSDDSLQGFPSCVVEEMSVPTAVAHSSASVIHDMNKLPVPPQKTPNITCEFLPHFQPVQYQSDLYLEKNCVYSPIDSRRELSSLKQPAATSGYQNSLCEDAAQQFCVDESCCAMKLPLLEGIRTDHASFSVDFSLEVTPDSMNECLSEIGSAVDSKSESVDITSKKIVLFVSEQAPWLSLLLFFALSGHSFLEGLALGTATHIQILLFAVILHKIVVSFGLGISLLRDNYSLKKYFFVMFLFCIMSPLGLAVGFCLREINPHSSFYIIAGLCTCVGAGTFLYVALVEIIGPELSRCRRHGSHPKDGWLLLFASTLGVIGMTVAAIGE
ncbi:metal cation transporter, ZIP family protein [Cardiosporidium cionae]|uniref:Metal cation transporter, ZIP family protein n=1 Tax=Cardiosporidium cionae TaxID=476202 RepID=A0ABQ7J4Q1_9APIC|nr:metal cation transporter, ZIP family protein [Cardiosporidium cionae]|eukprot:KAF8817975.1 metal cation transporter, ZIP family protein [Cardiosporidium cionae]